MGITLMNNLLRNLRVFPRRVIIKEDYCESKYLSLYHCKPLLRPEAGRPRGAAVEIRQLPFFGEIASKPRKALLW
jgi:hypothetical protein